MVNLLVGFVLINDYHFISPRWSLILVLNIVFVEAVVLILIFYLLNILKN